MRTANIYRKTKETEVRVEINLDGSWEYQIETGIGFFDHMLAQIAVHGLIDLTISATGDLDVDSHHTTEDCGLCLGSAVAEALGNRKGIVRTASVFVPMDEALCQAVVDFSGRPYFECKPNWSYQMVGGIPVTQIEHFFQSFAVTSAANLHLICQYGNDNHHMAEGMFKAFGRAVATAVTLDPRRQGQVPSSKGVL